MTEPELRDKDHAILKKISEGLDDTQKITAETTLQNHEVRYSLKKLEQEGLITVENPDRMVERVVDGQKRVFQHPKQAELTETGLQYLTEYTSMDNPDFTDLSHAELVNWVRDLEQEMKELEKSFGLLKKQIQKNI
jgi:predicted transcriptional regulator